MVTDSFCGPVERRSTFRFSESGFRETPAGVTSSGDGIIWPRHVLATWGKSPGNLTVTEADEPCRGQNRSRFGFVVAGRRAAPLPARRANVGGNLSRPGKKIERAFLDQKSIFAFGLRRAQEGWVAFPRRPRKRASAPRLNEIGKRARKNPGAPRTTLQFVLVQGHTSAAH